MARRKKGFISDDDLDSSGASDDSELGEDRGQPDDFEDEDPDERAERLRFSDPYGRRGHKRRKQNNGDAKKEEALYGVFAPEDGDDEGRRGSNGRGANSNRALRKPQAFVPSSTTSTVNPDSLRGAEQAEHERPKDLEEAVPLPDAETVVEAANSSDEDGDEMEESGESSSGESDEEDKPKIPRQRDEEIEDEAVLEAAMNNDGQHGAQRGGIGARSRGGIGSMARAAAATLVPEPQASTSAQNDTPSASASGTPEPAAARERRSFLTGGFRAGTPGNSTSGLGARKPPAAISKEEQKHFSKLATQGSFGFKLLEKMGWSAGSGLGAGGEGIVTPIESKLRPKAMGLAFEGFKERTKQSKEEERRRKGNDAPASDSDDNTPAGRRKKKGKAAGGAGQAGKTEKQGPPAWKQPKARRTKVQHMTYEQIVAQQAGGAASPSAQAGVGVIYDLAGNELSHAALSGSAHVHDVPTSDATRLPELRHNLAIIVDTNKGDLDNLAREGRNVADRRKWLTKEETRIRSVVQAEEARIARLETISEATSSVQKLSASLRYDERSTSEQLALFSDLFDNLLSTATPEEYEQYRLDEAVVGAIAPIMKAAWQEWDVLASPTAYLEDLRRWGKCYRLLKRDTEPEDSMQVDLFGASSYGGSRTKGKQTQRSMTAFETLLWTLWMPRVRSAVNNEWDPAFPSSVITLFSAWKSSGLLPPFLSDNILDQLVLPKLRKAIENWMPPRNKAGKPGKKDAPSLHHIVFPWLEHAGERMDEIMDEAKRRVRGWLKSWKARDGAPEGLGAWRDVIPKAEWDNLTLQHVVPQLSAHLRDRFSINPRQQDLAPLSLVLSWRPLLRSSILSQILEAEFFSKFLETLHTWLIAPSVNYEQVAEWYTWWRKEVFGESSGCGSLPGVERGFAKALNMMNQAMAMGEDAKYRLQKPDLRPSASSAKESAKRADKDREALKAMKARQQDPAAADVTFRSVVEELAAEANLIMLPTGRSHETSGMPLFRVSSGIDGKSGVTVYLHGDVVYAQDKEGAWKPVSVQDMIERGRRGA